MKQYKLYGFMNLFDIIPCFLFPIFQYKDEYYFQDGEDNKLNGFVPVKISAYTKIHKIDDYENVVGIKDKILSINSSPLYAFQMNEDKIVCGMSDFILSFFENYQTDNIILKEEINDLKNELSDTHSSYPNLECMQVASNNYSINRFDQSNTMYENNNIKHWLASRRVALNYAAIGIDGQMVCCSKNREINRDELNEIIDGIINSLSDLKKDDAEDIKDIVDMIKYELSKTEPKVDRLDILAFLLESMLTIVNHLPMLVCYLQRLIDYIKIYI